MPGSAQSSLSPSSQEEIQPERGADLVRGRTLVGGETALQSRRSIPSSFLNQGSVLEISGKASVQAQPDAVGRVLSDPVLLQRSLPGCRSLEPDGEGYRIEISIGVAAVRGTYMGSIRVLRHDPGQRFDFELSLEAPRGFVEARVKTSFTPLPQGTEIAYTAESELGGPLAALGQRVAAGVATMLVRQFCDGLGREAQALHQG